MRIGILTLHSNTNYGGGLQQIALFETLKALGHEPSILCVRTRPQTRLVKRIIGILTSYSPVQIVYSIKEILERIVKKPVIEEENIKMQEITDEFNYTHLNYTPKFNIDELSHYAADCDALICGSDQVWSNVYSDVLPLFCDGIPDFSGKKIAYAACSVHNRVPIYNRDKIRDLFSKFDAISVRDKTTKKLVMRYSSIRPDIVCDPTLLYDFRKYIKPSLIKDKYIFAYVLGNKTKEWHKRNIEHIKEETGISKVIVLTTSLDVNYPWADVVLNKVLAVEWMNLLREAQYVYTNSYHAVIFSLKFHRPFVAYYGDLVRSSRMLYLRNQFNLQNYIVKNPLKVKCKTDIEFDKYDIIINSLVKKSMSFLRQVLS